MQPGGLSGEPLDALGVVVVTYNSAAHIAGTLAAVLRQLSTDDDLVVVDNASTDGTVAATREAAPGATIVENRVNVGFAAACNAGAGATAAPLLLFLNPDARLEAGCLDVLRAVAPERPAWGAWQALVTMPEGDVVNTSGGVVHFLGFGWAGQCGESLEAVDGSPREVGFASGAALVVRREDWRATGGFDDAYFMYGEDLDLSLRLRLAGRGVGVAPAARVEHDYEFVKGSRKWFYLERNRWRTLIATYPGELLVVLAPALVLSEIALLAIAARQGWLAAKVRAQAAVVRSVPELLARRRRVQATRAVSGPQFAASLSASLDSPYLADLARSRWLAGAQRLYWRAATALLSSVAARHAPS